MSRARALAVAGLLLVGVAACGDDEGATSDEPSATTEGAGAGGGTGGEPVGERATSWDPADFDVDTSGLQCTDAAADDPTRGITETAVRVGSLTTESGPTTALWGDAVAAAQARFDRANAEGGVHGRQIELVASEDDGLDSSRSVDGARRLAEEVFAAVPVLSAIGSYADVFCDEVVPYFGWGFNGAYCDRAVGFGFNGCLVPESDVDYPSSAGVTFGPILEDEEPTMVLIGNEDAAARRGIENLSGALEDGGIEVVGELPVLPSNQPLADASPFVQDVLAEDPSGVWLISDFSNTIAMVQALKAAGYEGKIFSAVGYDPRLAASPDFDGVYTTLQWQPFENTDNEFVTQMNEDFDRYAPDTPKSLPAAAGYISADFFVAALEAAGPDLTVDSFLETLNGGDFAYDPPELFGGSYWPENHVNATPCGVIVQLVAGQYEIASPLACAQG